MLHSRAGYKQRDDTTGRVFGSGGSGIIIGKPDSNFTQGILSDPNNVVSIWKGPAHSGDADTGLTVKVDYATADCATTDYVVCERINGKWYVSLLEC